MGLDSFCEAPGITWSSDILVDIVYHTALTPCSINIKGVNGQTCQPIATGTLILEVDTTNSSTTNTATFVLKKCFLLHPSTQPQGDTATVIMGTDFVADAGGTITHEKNLVTTTLPNELGTVHFPVKTGRLYYTLARAITNANPSDALLVNATIVTGKPNVLSQDEAKKLHHLHGHALTYRELSTTYHAKITGGYPHCEQCDHFKTSKKPIRSVSPQSHNKRPVDVLAVCSDTNGPHPESSGGNKHAVLFYLPDFKLRYIYYVKSKKDVHMCLYALVVDMKRDGFDIGPNGKTPAWLHFDNDPSSYRTTDFVKTEATLNFTATGPGPYTPQRSNCEYVWRHLGDIANCLMNSLPGKMPTKYWPLAMTWSAHILNGVKRRSMNHKSAYEMAEDYLGLSIRRNHRPLALFGAKATASIGGHRGALDPRAFTGVFVGMSEQNECPLILNPKTNRIVEAFHATVSNTYSEVFNLKSDVETASTNATLGARMTRPVRLRTSEQGPTPPKATVSFEVPMTSPPDDEEPIEETARASEPVSVLDDNCDPLRTSCTVSAATIYSTRLFQKEMDRPLRTLERPTTNAHEHVNRVPTEDPLFPEPPDYMLLQMKERGEGPKSLVSALELIDAPYWQRAEDAEVDSLLSFGTFDEPTSIQLLTKGSIVLRIHRVLKTKWNPDTTYNKHKIRWCVDGRTQPDNGDRFAPAVGPAALKLFLADVCSKGHYVCADDQKSAYLQGHMDLDADPIYVHVPRDSTLHEDGHVRRLLRPLYGLGNAGQIWYNKYKDTLLALGFQQSQHEPCLFQRDMGLPTELQILLYVDDSILAAPGENTISIFHDEVKESLDFTTRNLTDFIGYKIEYNREQKQVTISQPAHAADLVAVLGLKDCRPSNIPMDPKVRLSKASDPKDILPPKVVTRYQKAIGTAIYLVQGVRVDIAYALSQLSRFMSAPTQEHWDCLILLGRYVKGTLDFSITYRVQPDRRDRSQLSGFGDCSLGGTHTEGRSQTGTVITFNGAAIYWASFLQRTTVALSTLEGEFMASGSLSQDIMYFRQLANELGSPQLGPSPVYCDNKPSLDALANQRVSPRTRHINRKFNYVRHLVDHGEICPVFMDGNHMPADSLTKATPRPLFIQHMALLCGINTLKTHMFF
jgi:hypothetical protein